MPTYFFADLVREASHDGGTGTLALAGALPGHRAFAGVVPPGATFHYAVTGITHAAEWEVGEGNLNAVGALVRSSVAASSAGGALVDFQPGLKSIALTVGSGWFTGQQDRDTELAGDIQALDAVVAGKQPLSTSHPAAATSAADDLVTLRRAGSWVNVPAAAFARQGDNGRFIAAGPLAAADGNATAPGISFASDAGTGWFRASAGVLAAATGAAERLRIGADGRVGIANPLPQALLDISYASMAPSLSSSAAAGITARGSSTLRVDIGSYPGSPYAGWVQSSSAGSAFPLVLNPLGGDIGIGTSAPRATLDVAGNIAADFTDNRTIQFQHESGSAYGLGMMADASGRGLKLFSRAGDGTGYIGFYTGGMTERVRIEFNGTLRPASDNGVTLGAASHRWAVVYAGTGTINTSDAREKFWRGGFTEAELRAASRIAREIGVFQWHDAIAAKGADAQDFGARLHIGVRAQAIWAIMADEGLVDPIRRGRPGQTPYAFLCWDRWTGKDRRRRHDRFGVRTDQLALFIAAAQEARLAALEQAAEQQP